MLILMSEYCDMVVILVVGKRQKEEQKALLSSKLMIMVQNICYKYGHNCVRQLCATMATTSWHRHSTFDIRYSTLLSMKHLYKAKTQPEQENLPTKKERKGSGNWKYNLQTSNFWIISSGIMELWKLGENQIVCLDGVFLNNSIQC